MQVVGSVAELWRHPVKSMQGQPVDQAELGEDGLAGDRRYALRHVESGRVLSAKRWPALLHAAAHLEGDGVVVVLPGGERVEAGDPDADRALSEWLDAEVRLERASPERPASYQMAVDPTDDGSQVVEFPCPPGSFLDAAAAHLLTTASLAEAARRRPDATWDVRRFRPTALISAEGEGWVEDAWIGSTVALGGAEIAVFAPTVRCAMPARPQPGLASEPDISRLLFREHGNNLGVYGAVRRAGPVAVGDPVVIAVS